MSMKRCLMEKAMGIRVMPGGNDGVVRNDNENVEGTDDGYDDII